MLLAFAIAGYFWWKTNLSPVSKGDQKIRLVIQKGWGATQIGNLLTEAGLIRNPLVFKVYIQLAGKSGSIKAGEYNLPPNLTLPQLVEKLIKGPDILWVTIPEGLRLEEVALKFAEGLGKEDKDDFVREFMLKAKGKEGYLFPDSYLFPKEATAEKIISVLVNTFDTKTKEVKQNLAMSQKFEDIVILASLIERETRTNAERPVVAGILLKRLNAGWPLQVDAAVQYAVATQNLKSRLILDNYWPILTKDDIDIESKFNTYKYPELPPAPICNPGLASIKAAADPKDSEYWFYLHDDKGEIHYARTIEEHNANIRKYLGK